MTIIHTSSNGAFDDNNPQPNFVVAVKKEKGGKLRSQKMLCCSSTLHVHLVCRDRPVLFWRKQMMKKRKKLFVELEGFWPVTHYSCLPNNRVVPNNCVATVAWPNFQIFVVMKWRQNFCKSLKTVNYGNFMSIYGEKLVLFGRSPCKN